MPLPMVHLAVAEGLHAAGEGGPSPEFLLGSIAPDAVHMRPNASSDDKHGTHLRDGDASGLEARVRRFAVARIAVAPQQRELWAGYAAHLLTDHLWVGNWFLPWRERLTARGLSRDALRTLYYREMDQVDLYLYHSMPWRPRVWRQLAAVAPLAMPGLLTADEVGRWRDRTLRWFDERRPEPRIQPEHISVEEVLQFADDAAARVAALFAAWEV